MINMLLHHRHSTALEHYVDAGTPDELLSTNHRGTTPRSFSLLRTALECAWACADWMVVARMQVDAGTQMRRAYKAGQKAMHAARRGWEPHQLQKHYDETPSDFSE